MDVLDIRPVTKVIGEEPYPTLMKKGIRSECLFNVPAVDVIIHPYRWIDCFYRFFWEDNFLHIENQDNKSTFIPWEKNGNFMLRMRMTLAEVLDFLYDATPPLYRSQLKESTKTIDDIVALMKTFLLEETPQTETYYSILKKITKYGVFDKPNNMDLYSLQVLRSMTPNGPLCQVIYANRSLEDLTSERCALVNGIFLFHANNNDDMYQLVKILDEWRYAYPKQFIVCEIYKDPNGGSYVMIKYNYSQDEGMAEVIKRTYKQFLHK